jgi:hypothetical protein
VDATLTKIAHRDEITAVTAVAQKAAQSARSSQTERFAMFRLPFQLVCAGAALVTVLGAGCLGGAQLTGPGSGGNGGSRSDMAVDVKALFEANVQPLLLKDCGACHAQAGGAYPGFLAAVPPASLYTTFTNFPGLVGSTPETSRILTKDTHTGPSFHKTDSYTPSPELTADAKVIADWITVYNDAGGRGIAGSTDMAVKATITPVMPMMGTVNIIDLGQLDSQFAGMTVSFTPTPVGSTQIKLSDVKLKASPALGVEVKSPVFARYDAAQPQVAVDIDYSMLGADVTAYMGSEVTMGPGVMIFAYQSGQLLGLSFDTIVAKMGAGDMGGSVGMCKNVAGFTAFKPQLTGSAGIGCPSCHNNGTGGFSTGGFNNAGADATSCAATLVNVNVANPAQSIIFVEITKTPAHPGGQLAAGADTTFLNALTTWLDGEK